MRFFLGVCICILFFSRDGAFAQCRDLPDQEVESWLGSQDRLVFFASWCLSCKPHLEEVQAQPDGVGFVVAFDELESASRALKSFGIGAACVKNLQLLERFDVFALPRKVLLSQGRETTSRN